MKMYANGEPHRSAAFIEQEKARRLSVKTCTLTFWPLWKEPRYSDESILSAKLDRTGCRAGQ